MRSLHLPRRALRARSPRRAAGALVATALIASSVSVPALAAEPTTVREAIPDPALYQCVRTWYEGLSGTTLAPEDDVPPAAASTATAPFSCADPAVVDLTGLDLLDGTTSVTLTGVQATDLGPLDGMTGARTLVLTDTPAADLAPLAGLHLTTIRLTRTAVTDLSPLAGQTALAGLAVEGSAVTDLSVVRDLPALRSLGIKHTAVADLSPLTGHPLLTQIAALHNEITDITALGTLPALRTAELAGNHIADVSPLAQAPLLLLADATGQTITRPTVAIGAPTDAFVAQGIAGAAPLTQTAGPVPVVDGATWTFETFGTATMTWDVPLRGPSMRFSGAVEQSAQPSGEPIDPTMPFSPAEPIEPIDPVMPPVDAAPVDPATPATPGPASPEAVTPDAAAQTVQGQDVLAVTGTDLAVPTTAALLMLTGGTALALAARRRTPTRTR